MTDPFGQVRSRVCQLAVMVSVTVIGYMTGSSGHGHASADLIDRIEKDLAILLEISQLSKRGTPKNRRCHYPFSCLSTHPRRRRCACTRPASRRRGPFPEFSLQLFNLSQLSLRLYCLSKTRMALFDRFAGIRGFG